MLLLKTSQKQIILCYGGGAAIDNNKMQIVSDELAKVSEDIKALIPMFNLSDFYFAGGCIYCLWNGREIKDYDIFCTNRKAIAKLKRFLSGHPEMVNCNTKNAYTVGKYQFVIKHIGAAEKEAEKFDFKHNCYYYDHAGLHSVFGWDYIDSNTLIFNSSRARDVLNILTRIPKFVGRGMEISQKEVLDILEVGTRPTRVFFERHTIQSRRRGKSHY